MYGENWDSILTTLEEKVKIAESLYKRLLGGKNISSNDDVIVPSNVIDVPSSKSIDYSNYSSAKSEIGTKEESAYWNNFIKSSNITQGKSGFDTGNSQGLAILDPQESLLNAENFKTLQNTVNIAENIIKGLTTTLSTPKSTNSSTTNNTNNHSEDIHINNVNITSNDVSDFITKLKQKVRSS